MRRLSWLHNRPCFFDHTQNSRVIYNNKKLSTRQIDWKGMTAKLCFWEDTGILRQRRACVKQTPSQQHPSLVRHRHTALLFLPLSSGLHIAYEIFHILYSPCFLPIRKKDERVNVYRGAAAVLFSHSRRLSMCASLKNMLLKIVARFENQFAIQRDTVQTWKFPTSEKVLKFLLLISL